jgi:rsbT co-antagonist protein RsbR
MHVENESIDLLLSEEQENILREWSAELSTTGEVRNPSGLNAEQAELFRGFHAAIRADGDAAGFEDAVWNSVRDSLTALSRSRVAQGSTAAETNAFVLAFKRPLFSALQRRLNSRPDQLVAAIWTVSSMIDKMAQWTVTTYQRNREEIIKRQQQELLELSTPVIKLWHGVLAAPMIGTLDSTRAQIVMETLLQRIVETGSELAIIDITGVPTVDTLVAQHLLKTVTAIRLMGADCIISGIRPQIAQTIVHLGIELQGIITKASLADALALALRMTGYVVTRAKT